ncbi:MAG: 4'-phosphopantetheinyl transferase family protein [Thermodesulfobacteriota bacterium]
MKSDNLRTEGLIKFFSFKKNLSESFLFTDFKKDFIHIWTFKISDFKDNPYFLTKLLDKDDLKKAYRFKNNSSGMLRFKLARGALRLLCSKYYSVSSEKIIFSYNENLKPFVKSTAHNIFFNLSHSSDTALIIFSDKRYTGADIEMLRNIVNIQKIAFSYFHPEELTFLGSIPESQKSYYFIKIWTLKEAFVKAFGKKVSKNIFTDFSVIPENLPDILKKDEFCLWDKNEINCRLLTFKHENQYLAAGVFKD